MQQVSRGTGIWAWQLLSGQSFTPALPIVRENPNLDSAINFLQQTENFILSSPPGTSKQQLPFELRGTVPVLESLQRSGEKAPILFPRSGREHLADFLCQSSASCLQLSLLRKMGRSHPWSSALWAKVGPLRCDQALPETRVVV